MEKSLEFLTDQERDCLIQFMQNPQMVSAVRKVLETEIIHQGVQNKGEKSEMNRNWVFGVAKNEDMSDEEFGRAVRVHTEALINIELAFNTMVKVVPIEKNEAKGNKAR